MDDNLYSLSQKLGNILKQKKLTIAVVESCTGGFLSSVITDIPGSSVYFNLGLVVYQDNQKQKFLEIPARLFKKYSAVSEPVTSLMAEKAAVLSGSDVGVGITGYAGPSGGTEDDPVGTVYLAVSYKNKTIKKRRIFDGPREEVKTAGAKWALSVLGDILR